VKVSCFNCVPSAFITNTWEPFQSFEVNEISFPFGEILGEPKDFAGGVNNRLPLPSMFIL
jgi:hypothetical protein